VLDSTSTGLTSARGSARSSGRTPLAAVGSRVNTSPFSWIHRPAKVYRRDALQQRLSPGVRLPVSTPPEVEGSPLRQGRSKSPERDGAAGFAWCSQAGVVVKPLRQSSHPEQDQTHESVFGLSLPRDSDHLTPASTSSRRGWKVRSRPEPERPASRRLSPRLVRGRFRIGALFRAKPTRFGDAPPRCSNPTVIAAGFHDPFLSLRRHRRVVPALCRLRRRTAAR
jgi:hypothetical protein